MKWQIPKKVKIYEALGTIGDGRIEIFGHSAKVYSSSGKKFYTVTYDPQEQSIMSNDNSSYWQGTLGYPAIAYLLKTGVIAYEEKYAEALRGIKWKDLNTKYKNDFEKTAEDARKLLLEKGCDLAHFLQTIDRIHEDIIRLDLSLLGKKQKPPTGY